MNLNRDVACIVAQQAVLGVIEHFLVKRCPGTPKNVCAELHGQQIHSRKPPGYTVRMDFADKQFLSASVEVWDDGVVFVRLERRRNLPSSYFGSYALDPEVTQVNATFTFRPTTTTCANA